jgi:5-methylcytosine-specific restriction protein B
VLIIDEINRGNIPRIFGELLTLIEPAKRWGMPEQMSAKLAVSGQEFSVPRNLHILGTMNTADRSIAMMDIALRRRFEFEELMPDAELVRRIVGRGGRDSLGTLASAILRDLNRRLVFLYDRDHQIGHAYFLRVKSLDDLRQVILKDVLPLLQEYFYGAWDRVCIALGCPYTADGKPARLRTNPSIVNCIIEDEKKVIGFDHDDFADKKLLFEVNPEFRSSTGEDQLRPFLQGILIDPLSGTPKSEPEN